MPPHEPQQMLQQKQRQDQPRESKKAAALNERDAVAAQTETLGDQTVAPVRRDTPAPAPPPAMRSALAAKAAPSSVGGNGPQTVSADSSVSANVARTFSVQRLVSNAAYRRCAGQVVTVSQPAGASAGAPAHLMTVRLDSAAQRARVRGFAVTATNGQSNVGGWWVPAGADSAVVSLTNPGSAAGAAPSDLATADTAGAIPAIVTRVHCPSP
jgi:hypothetical protein